MHLSFSPSVSWRLVLPWVLLTVGEGRLLVAGGPAGVWCGWVRSSVISGWVSVLLVKFTHALTIPCISKVGQDSLLRERSRSVNRYHIYNQLACTISNEFVNQMQAALEIEERLTQLMTEKNEKATMALAASPGMEGSSVVLDHRLARRQKQTNQRNVQAAVPGRKYSRAIVRLR